MTTPIPSLDDLQSSRGRGVMVGTGRLLRDLLAVVLVLIGLIGLLVVAFVVDVRLGAALAFAYVTALGVFLGTER